MCVLVFFTSVCKTYNYNKYMAIFTKDAHTNVCKCHVKSCKGKPTWPTTYS